MHSAHALPVSRSSSQSTCTDSGGSIGKYTRIDEPCMLTFKVGDPVWTRANGVWSLGVVISDCYFQQSQKGSQPIPTFTVLTRVGSPYAPLAPITLSPLFGTLKPANTYTGALLHAEGVFPTSGGDRIEVMDLQMRAQAWLDRRSREARARMGLW